MKYQICENCLHVATTTLVQLDYKNEKAVPVDLTFGGEAKAVLPAHNIAGRHS